MSIDEHKIEGCYIYAKKYYHHQIDRIEATNSVYKYFGMNQGSANDYIQAFYCMMNGERYTRTINTKATKYFLEKIETEFGDNYLEQALVAVKKHTEYYGSVSKGRLRSIESLLKNYN
ncbi:hypothetical protein [Halobacillus sp. A5]|uniref:hypothetical protein n=1 Tax=Halobacillus sp. A5 TaxID=2880263 RepID=UPI0020A63833|nr:hypothetical protein [Halobacillus sp. A5]MCP3028765.1 hypothetical protein [Halobacillus sp. A5]